MTSNTYILSVRSDGRVILDFVEHGAVLETIQANHWIDARSKVKTPVAHDDGYGFIFNDEVML